MTGVIFLQSKSLFLLKTVPVLICSHFSDSYVVFNSKLVPILVLLIIITIILRTTPNLAEFHEFKIILLIL